MHERSKLKEAHDFLERMHAEQVDYAAFTRDLSAFMASARSVLQYACKEAQVKAGGQKWYGDAVAKPIIRFFKDKRDISIHDRPVRPARKFTTEAAGHLSLADEDDEMIIPYPHSRIVAHYEFEDRPGEEVTDLARQYLIALEGLVEDGIAMGWITG